MLKVGWIDYANCSPLLLQIEQRLAGTDIVLEHGVPAQLNAALAAGQIDMCISSSIEFARHANEYLVLPGHCIGSDGPVQSVLLFSDRPVQALEGERVWVTAESATSVVLLQIVMKFHWGLREFTLEPTRLPWQEALAAAPGVLLIGDAALQAAMAARARYCYDLGQAWKEFTGLPFVYALWQVRQAAVMAESSALRMLLTLLDQARDRLPQDAKQLAFLASESRWMGADRLADYWHHITYRLDDRHVAGLMRYYQLAQDLGLIASRPDLRFVEV